MIDISKSSEFWIYSKGIELIQPETMNNTKNISEILDDVEVKTTNNRISIEYNHNSKKIRLWFCEFYINNDIWVISEFYTSNIKWKDRETLWESDLPWVGNIDILKSPIKDIWKELFKNIIDLFLEKWVKTISLIYSRETNAKVFYQKMCDYFSSKIISLSEPMPWWLMIKLRQ